MMRRLVSMGGSLLLASLAVAPAMAATWPLAGGDASRSGAHGAAGGELPVVPAWSRSGPSVRTPVIVSGGGDAATQRVAYGSRDGRVRVHVLATGAPVGPEAGIDIIDAAVDEDASDTFGSGAAAAGFADTSTPSRLGVAYVVHNDGAGVEIARIDLATGARVDRTDTAVPYSFGCEVNGSPVLTPPSAGGGRLLFATLRGSCSADGTVVRVPISGDAASPGATLGPMTFARAGAMAAGAGPSLIVLADAAGIPRFHVAVGRLGGVDFFDAGRTLSGSPSGTASPDLSVAIGADETARTVSAPATADGMVAGAEGAGTPPAPAMYVAADAAGATTVYRLVQRAGGVAVDGSATLAASGVPAPALVVAETVTPSGVTPGGRLVVTSAANLTVLRTADLAAVGRLSPEPLPPGAGFARTVAAVTGGYAFATRDGSADAVPEAVAMRLATGAAVGGTDFQRLADGQGGVAGQPAIARGLVVLGGASGALGYATRDVTAPEVSIDAPAGGVHPAGRLAVRATASDERGVAAVQARLLAAEGGVRAGGRTTGAESWNGGASRGTFAVSLDTSGLPAGEYALEVVASDAAGNDSTPARRRVWIDSGRAGAVQGPRGACANVVAGTARGDRLRGTEQGDRIDGGRGNDVLAGGAGADCLFGATGRDRLSGGRGHDRLAGGPGPDRLAGGAGNDHIEAGAGRDSLSGGAGRDRIVASDGARDRIRCGRGRDRVTADVSDRVGRDCERVRRVRAASRPRR